MLLAEMIRQPTKLQSYAWPAVFKGFDVVGIAPTRCKLLGGKTLSYLIPLANLLNHDGAYCNLPKYGIGVRFWIISDVVSIFSACFGF